MVDNKMVLIIILCGVRTLKLYFGAISG